MKVPFTVEQFFDVFAQYNNAVFPAQFILVLTAICGLTLMHSNKVIKDKLLGGFLGLLWIWTGLVYHIGFFTEINKAAYFFGSLFILEGILILFYVSTAKLVLNFSSSIKGYTGYFFIVFALLIYPAIGYLLHGETDTIISLGLPCPSAIFTFGCFMLSTKRISGYLWIIPFIWAIIGLSAAINFGVYQDFMILVAAATALVFNLKSSKIKPNFRTGL